MGCCEDGKCFHTPIVTLHTTHPISAAAQCYRTQVRDSIPKLDGYSCTARLRHHYVFGLFMDRIAEHSLLDRRFRDFVLQRKFNQQVIGLQHTIPNRSKHCTKPELCA